MRLVVFTPPYAGMIGAMGALGTPSSLAHHLGVPVISVANLFRVHCQQGCAIGNSFKAHVDSQALVPDADIVTMVLQRLAEPDTAAGFVLHNYPRTSTQAALLDRALADRGWAIDAVLQIAFSETEVEQQFATNATFSRELLRSNTLATAALHEHEHYTGQWTTVDGTYDPDLTDQRAFDAVADLIADHGGATEQVLAERLLRQSVAAGSSTALVRLATFLAWQRSPADVAQAEALLVSAATANAAGAHNFLGLLLSDMDRHDEAADHFRAAIAEGDTTAMTNFAGILHDTGRDAEAFALMRQAAELGDEFAFFIVQRNLDAESELYQAIEAVFHLARPDAELRLFCMRPGDWRLNSGPAGVRPEATP